jgi:hypothetical protein
MLLEQRLDHAGVADQDEFRVGMAGKREGGARHNHGGAMVPSHGVERNSNLLRHGMVDRSLDRGPTRPIARATPNNSLSAGHRKWVIFPRACLGFPVVPARGRRIWIDARRCDARQPVG